MGNWGRLEFGLLDLEIRIVNSFLDETSPRLTPYPDWESNDIHAKDSIVNILRVRVDACDRLWAVDSGIDDIWGEFKSVQPPKLIAIDLKTNKVFISVRHTF